MWQDSQRTDFYKYPGPPWKARLGERAAAFKLRCSRMKPFLLYLDNCRESAGQALNVLDALRREQTVLLLHSRAGL